ncbi:MAG: hypothetical protein ACI8RW_001278 [Porticoccaceae bacterium]|jgi:hypothetical protein
MKKNCFLGEVAIVASNLFLDDFKKFNFDVVKTLDSWDEKIEGKVSSDYDKLAIKLWPIGSLKGENNLVARDEISKVLIFETECSLDDYFSLDSLNEREEWLYSCLELFVKFLPNQTEINGQNLLHELKESG